MIRTVTHTCTVPSFGSLEHLLLQTAAALCDAAVDFAVGSADAAAASTTTIVWTTVAKDAWSGTTTHVRHVGWVGAVRALLLLSSTASAAACVSDHQVAARAESWLEAVALNLVQVHKQKGKSTREANKNGVQCALVLYWRRRWWRSEDACLVLNLFIWFIRFIG